MATNTRMEMVHTVTGPVYAEALGTTLMHEHVLVDFRELSVAASDPPDREEVARVMLPYLQAIAGQGVRTLVECTPEYLGRDPVLLRTLSEASGLQIVTNTGWYKAPYLPEAAWQLEPSQIAEHWITEWREGIEGTTIRPGIIKIAVNPGELEPVQQKIVRAAAIAHRTTGLSVMAHTGHAAAAQESLDLIAEEGMPAQRYIIAHADQIGKDVPVDDPAWDKVLDQHAALLERGAWLEYDGIGWGPMEHQVALVLAMLDRGYEDQLLLSQDAGWYHAGEPQGGDIRPMTGLLDEFVPALRMAGLDTATMTKLLVTNPGRALAASS